MQAKPGAIKRFFKTLREAEWITSLLQMSGITGLITGVFTGTGMTWATIVSGFVWPTVVFYSVLTAAATVLIVGAIRQWSISPTLETPSAPTPIAAPTPVDEPTSDATEAVRFYEDQEAMLADKVAGTEIKREIGFTVR